MPPNSPPPKWPMQVNRNQFYGNPAGANGKLDPKWEAANLVLVEFPWKAVAAWDVSTPIKRAKVHRLCAESLKRVFAAIWLDAIAEAGSIAGAQRVIEDWGMHLFGGGFNFRPTTGGTALSSHAWGCAVDFDPVRNGWKDSTPNFANVPEVLKAFADEGWVWFGRNKSADGMHWQAARFA